MASYAQRRRRQIFAVFVPAAPEARRVEAGREAIAERRAGTQQAGRYGGGRPPSLVPALLVSRIMRAVSVEKNQEAQLKGIHEQRW